MEVFRHHTLRYEVVSIYKHAISRVVCNVVEVFLKTAKPGCSSLSGADEDGISAMPLPAAPASLRQFIHCCGVLFMLVTSSWRLCSTTSLILLLLVFGLCHRLPAWTTSMLLMALAGFANSIIQAVLSMAVQVSDAQHDKLLQLLAMDNLDATYATCQRWPWSHISFALQLPCLCSMPHALPFSHLCDHAHNGGVWQCIFACLRWQ